MPYTDCVEYVHDLIIPYKPKETECKTIEFNELQYTMYIVELLC